MPLVSPFSAVINNPLVIASLATNMAGNLAGAYNQYQQQQRQNAIMQAVGEGHPITETPGGPVRSFLHMISGGRIPSEVQVDPSTVSAEKTAIQDRRLKAAEALAGIAAKAPNVVNDLAFQKLITGMGFDPSAFAGAGKQQEVDIYGPQGQTKRVVVPTGQEYTPPSGWSLAKPTKESMVTIYGPSGETRRVSVEPNKDYVPPRGWTLEKPTKAPVVNLETPISPADIVKNPATGKYGYYERSGKFIPISDTPPAKPPVPGKPRDPGLDRKTRVDTVSALEKQWDAAHPYAKFLMSAAQMAQRKAFVKQGLGGMDPDEYVNNGPADENAAPPVFSGTTPTTYADKYLPKGAVKK